MLFYLIVCLKCIILRVRIIFSHYGNCFPASNTVTAEADSGHGTDVPCTANDTTRTRPSRKFGFFGTHGPSTIDDPSRTNGSYTTDGPSTNDGPCTTDGPSTADSHCKDVSLVQECQCRNTEYK